MPRPKKNAKYQNLYLEKNLIEMLEQYCEDTGQSKTVAVERILSKELKEYYAKPKDRRVPIG